MTDRDYADKEWLRDPRPRNGVAAALAVVLLILFGCGLAVHGYLP